MCFLFAYLIVPVCATSCCDHWFDARFAVKQLHEEFLALITVRNIHYDKYINVVIITSACVIDWLST
jgi:hypothetical protein